MIRSRLRIVSIVVVWVLVGGCGGKRPPVHYYTLGPAEISSSTWRSNNDAGLDVGVNAFHVELPYARDKIVYRIGEQSPEVAFYAYHRWAGPLLSPWSESGKILPHHAQKRCFLFLTLHFGGRSSVG